MLLLGPNTGSTYPPIPALSLQEEFLKSSRSSHWALEEWLVVFLLHEAGGEIAHQIPVTIPFDGSFKSLDAATLLVI